MSDYDLQIINPAEKGATKNVAYVGKPNILQLTLTNHSMYPLGFGSGSDCATLGFQITANILSAVNFSVDRPWTIVDGPTKQDPNWVFQLQPTSIVTLEANGSITITLEQVTPTQSGLGTIGLTCPSQALSAAASFTVEGSVQLGDIVLFGESAPLTLNYFVNSPSTQNSLFVSPPVTPTSSKVENAIHVQVVFQPDNLPSNAKTAHADKLVNQWDLAKQPFFGIYFPCFTTTASDTAKYYDLTDAFKVSEPGYNGWTSAWNIKCSLQESDPNKTQNNFWRIELDHDNPIPFWKVYPLHPNIFTQSSGGTNPGMVLDLYFSHIFSDLDVSPDNAETFLFFKWFNFKDLSSDSTPTVLANYADGGQTPTISKIPVPAIQRFELVPESYLAQIANNSNNLYNATFSQGRTTYAVYPPQSTLYFQFRWYIMNQSWYANNYQVQLLPPNTGEISDMLSAHSALGESGSRQFVTPYSEQFTINLNTEAYKVTMPWTLQITHTASGTLVGQQPITPFLSLVDFLKQYLPGKVYAADAQTPSRFSYFLAFTSPTLVHWNDPTQPGGWLNSTWTMTPQNDGSILLAVDGITNTFVYSALTDSWTDQSTQHNLRIPSINWVGLTNMVQRPASGLDVPSLQVLNRRLYLAYRQALSNTLALTSSADGWNWVTPQPVPQNAAASMVPPAVSYFNSQWVIAFVAPGDPKTVVLLASLDGQTWATPMSLAALSSNVHSVQLVTKHDRLYLYSEGADGTVFLLWTQNIAGQWQAASQTKGAPAGALFEDNGLFYVAKIDDQSGTGLLQLAAVEATSDYYQNLETLTVAPSVPSSEQPRYIQGASLPGGTLMIDYRPALAAQYNSQLKFAYPDTALTAQLPPHPAVNYWEFRESIGFFKNYLLRLSQLNTVDYFLSYKTFFSWPQAVVGTTQSTTNSIVTFLYQGRPACFLAYLDNQHHIHILFSQDGSTWQSASQISVAATAATLFVFGWTLWIAYVDQNAQQVYTLSSTDGVNWLQQQLVSTVNTTSIPAFVASEKTEQLYLAIVKTDHTTAWYQLGSNQFWNDVSSQGSVGLPTSINSLALTTFRQNLYCATVDTSNLLRLQYATDFGNAWTVINFKLQITTDQPPALIVMYNQLIMVYRDLTDQFLKMVRSADGQTWTGPESLYTSIQGNPALTLWNDRLFLALQTPFNPNMISIMTTAGLDSTELPTHSIIQEITSLVTVDKIVSIVSYYDPSGNPANSRLYMLALDSANDAYYVYQKAEATPDTYLAWKNILSGPLPNPNEGYQLIAPFFVAPDGTIVLTAALTGDPMNTMLLTLDPGASSYRVALNAKVHDITFDPKDSNMYAASNVAGVYYREIGPKAPDWAPLNVNAPGGKTINIEIVGSIAPSLQQAFGYNVVPCTPEIKSAPMANTSHPVRFINFTNVQLKLTYVPSDTSTPTSVDFPAYSIVQELANNGDCWQLAHASQCLNYYQITEVPFKQLTATAQGNLYAVQSSASKEGAIYYLDNVGKQWQPVGIDAVTIAADQSGALYAATSYGKILKVTRSLSGAAVGFSVVAIGETFLTNIKSIAVDGDGVLWVVSENSQFFRSISTQPVASDPECDVCVFNNLLYLAYRQDDDLKIAYSQDGANWSVPVSIDVGAKLGPSLCQYQSQLWASFVSPYVTDDYNPNPLFVKNSLDGQRWGRDQGIYTQSQSPYSAVVRPAGSQLAVVFSGSHSQLSVAVSQNGSQWKASPVANIAATRFSFALFTKTSQYYIAYQDPTSGHVMLITSTDLASWTPVSLDTMYATSQRPVLATYQQQLALAFADGQGIVQILTSPDGQTWTKQTVSPQVSVPQSFAMCSFMGQGNLQEQLYIVFADGVGVIRTRFANF